MNDHSKITFEGFTPAIPAQTDTAFLDYITDLRKHLMYVQDGKINTELRAALQSTKLQLKYDHSTLRETSIRIPVWS